MVETVANPDEWVNDDEDERPPPPCDRCKNRVVDWQAYTIDASPPAGTRHHLYLCERCWLHIIEAIGRALTDYGRPT